MNLKWQVDKTLLKGYQASKWYPHMHRESFLLCSSNALWKLWNLPDTLKSLLALAGPATSDNWQSDYSAPSEFGGSIQKRSCRKRPTITRSRWVWWPRRCRTGTSCSRPPWSLPSTVLSPPARKKALNVCQQEHWQGLSEVAVLLHRDFQIASSSSIKWN